MPRRSGKGGGSSSPHARSRRKRPPTWRYPAGAKGVNRVCVYERRDRPSVLYIEWWDGDGKRIQRTLESETGTPVPNTPEGRKLAVKIAEAVADERERLIYRELYDAYGVTKPRTVSELLERIHDDRSESWSEQYQRDQARYRKFWDGKLGALRLAQVNAAVVQRIAADEARKRDWSPRSEGALLRYIVDAFYYAEKQLKWIGPVDNLSAVRIPSPKSQASAYTVDEVRKLLRELEKIGDVPAWIGHVAWQTGRRLSAIRNLKKRDVLATEQRALIRFRTRTENKKGGQAVVRKRGAELTGRLLTLPGRYMCGAKPPTLKRCNRWLREAEEAAGIEHVRGRAWHAVKRRYATATVGLKGREFQSATRRETLDTTYTQDDLEPKDALAEKLASMVE